MISQGINLTPLKRLPAIISLALVCHGCAAMSSLIEMSRLQSPAVENLVTNSISPIGNDARRPAQLKTSKPKVSPALGDSPIRPVFIGEASWYGPGFVGKKTASGDIFDDAKFTAAHKTIALGSKATVTNLKNGKAVEVEINDRGPFVRGRVIDLSYAAARALDMVNEGTTKVHIELHQE